ncbi:hypothetical protein ARTHROSP310_13980 [Arthrobacter sp. AD-310]
MAASGFAAGAWAVSVAEYLFRAPNKGPWTQRKPQSRGLWSGPEEGTVENLWIVGITPVIALIHWLPGGLSVPAGRPVQVADPASAGRPDSTATTGAQAPVHMEDGTFVNRAS